MRAASAVPDTQASLEPTQRLHRRVHASECADVRNTAVVNKTRVNTPAFVRGFLLRACGRSTQCLRRDRGMQKVFLPSAVASWRN